ncbi:hypothetical protein NPIL_286011 [Nephila pilipes]|uniref:Uncharacterized protein n=1 Tax=Nephila pilipes TaxID=299642 RepID=A0A8X6UC22_NEPPI|nr:hypothetical protein NPIL_286011 [Nephila pilipes]
MSYICVEEIRCLRVEPACDSHQHVVFTGEIPTLLIINALITEEGDETWRENCARIYGTDGVFYSSGTCSMVRR